jgi:hypothetical protein
MWYNCNITKDMDKFGRTFCSVIAEQFKFEQMGNWLARHAELVRVVHAHADLEDAKKGQVTNKAEVATFLHIMGTDYA